MSQNGTLANTATTTTLTETDYFGLILAFSSQVVITLVLLLLFSFFRPRFIATYAPKLLIAEGSETRKTPDPLTPSLFSWLKVIRFDQAKLKRKLGLDSVVLLRFLSFLSFLFFILAQVGIILCVVYYYAPSQTGEPGVVARPPPVIGDNAVNFYYVAVTPTTTTAHRTSATSFRTSASLTYIQSSYIPQTPTSPIQASTIVTIMTGTTLVYASTISYPSTSSGIPFYATTTIKLAYSIPYIYASKTISSPSVMSSQIYAVTSTSASPIIPPQSTATVQYVSTILSAEATKSTAPISYPTSTSHVLTASGLYAAPTTVGLFMFQTFEADARTSVPIYSVLNPTLTIMTRVSFAPSNTLVTFPTAVESIQTAVQSPILTLTTTTSANVLASSSLVASISSSTSKSHSGAFISSSSTISPIPSQATTMISGSYLMSSVKGPAAIVIGNDTASDTGQNVTVVGSRSPPKALYLSQITLDNINGNSTWCWFPVGFAYFVTVVSLYCLYSMNRDYQKTRREYYMSKDFKDCARSRLILLTLIPSDYKSVPKLHKLFERVSSSPFSVKLGIHFSDLPQLIKSHQSSIEKMELKLQVGLSDTPNLSRMRAAVKEDMLEIASLEEQIYLARHSAISEKAPANFAYVCFNSSDDAYQALKNYRSTYKKEHMNVPVACIAPEKNDMVWDNLNLSREGQRGRQDLAALTGIACFTIYTGLVFFTQFLNNLGNIGQYLNDPFSQTVLKSYFGLLVVQSIVAPVFFVFVNILVLPTVLRRISVLQGDISRSGVEKLICSMFFAFQLYQFLITASFNIGIGVFLAYFINDTTNIDSLYNVASQGFVNTSNYFTNFIIFGLTSKSLEIMQLARLAWMNLKLLLLRLSARKRDKYQRAPRYNFTLIYGTLLLNLLVALCFSVVSPLILPFAFLQFLLAGIVMRYQLLYVYDPAHETNGSWWPQLFPLACTCIATFQTFTCFAVVLFCVLRSTNGNGKAGASLIGALVVLTLSFWLYFKKELDPLYCYEADAMKQPEKPTNIRGISLKPAVEMTTQEEFDLYPPSLTEPLWNVWVSKDLQDLARIIYTPKYKDMEDFCTQNNIPVPALVEKSNVFNSTETLIAEPPQDGDGK